MVHHGVWVSMDYVLTVDGEQVDASEPGKPLKFVQGRGQIIRGLEEELVDMMVGESKEVVVQPSMGYGLENPQLIADLPRSRFNPNMPLEVGAMLQMPTPNGQPMQGLVVRLTDETVRVNFNHPLAGKTLNFKVTIVDLS
jgi:FKBP-type peptidyl-prolyl cis-trans isomerase SlyD